jgi:hypothetical protein
VRPPTPVFSFCKQGANFSDIMLPNTIEGDVFVRPPDKRAFRPKSRAGKAALKTLLYTVSGPYAWFFGFVPPGCACPCTPIFHLCVSWNSAVFTWQCLTAPHRSPDSCSWASKVLQQSRAAPLLYGNMPLVYLRCGP